MYYKRKRTAARSSSRKPVKKLYSAKRKTRPSLSAGVTNQHDSILQYRYRRLPRKKLLYARRRDRVFTNNLLNKIGTQTIVRNSSVNITATVSNQQWGAVHLYGMAGSNNTQEIGTNDLDSIRLADTRIIDAAKVYFSNAVVDLTVRNNSVQVLELDMYILRCRVRNRLFSNFASCVLNAQGDTLPIGSTGITMTTRGATPFEFPDICKYFKVLSKKKFFISGGNVITYQWREYRNKVISGDQFNVAPSVGTENAFKDFWTTTILFVGKAVTGTVESADFTIGATRSYRYKMLEDNENRDGVI